MDKLRIHLNSLAVIDQAAFAVRCGTTIGYLRKAISMGTEMKAKLCLAIERQSAGAVRCEDLIPGADWAVVRETPDALYTAPVADPDQVIDAVVGEGA